MGGGEQETAPAQEEQEQEQVENGETAEAVAQEILSLPDLLWGLLKHSAGIVVVGCGVTSEFLDCVQRRVDEVPEEEEEEDEESGSPIQKPVKEEKLGPFEFLCAVGDSANVIISAGLQENWIAVSNSTMALRLLSTHPVAAE